MAETKNIKKHRTQQTQRFEALSQVQSVSIVLSRPNLFNGIQTSLDMAEKNSESVKRT